MKNSAFSVGLILILFFLLMLASWWLSGGTSATGAHDLSLTGKNLSWTSMLPPLLAIVFALVSRQVMFSLFLGIWIGAFLAHPSGASLFTSFFSSLTDYIVPAVADKDHVSILIFSLLIGGMIGVITENGGMQGVVERISRFIRNRRQGQLATSLFGMMIFFDDYSNTMIVGSAMRSLTDRLGITRAKLAYLVDSTAAPVATIALVSTWIGAMVAYIAEAEIFMTNYSESAYLVFLNSLPYNFYAFFTISFVLMVAWTDRDFGPMLRVRRKLWESRLAKMPDTYDFYRLGDRFRPERIAASHWAFAAVPVVVLVISTLAGLWVTGKGTTLQEIVGSSDSYSSLLWASLLSLFVAVVMTLARRLLPVEQMLRGIRQGMHLMFDGLMILVLAWAISAVTKELGTADYLISVLHDILNPYWTPLAIFILAGLISFATGSSWGTMGIMMPLVIPLVWNTCQTGGLPMDESSRLVFGCVSAVLAGAVWGDHCSPISDTTILSSSACHCNHIEHVQTQLPYAVLVAGVSVLATTAVFVLELPVWLVYCVGFIILYAVLHYFGKRPESGGDLKEEAEPV